jgi:hypothetical protein
MLQIDWTYIEGDLDSFYAIALPKRRDLKTIRDLTSEHLDMLKSIRDESYKAIELKFGLDKT